MPKYKIQLHNPKSILAILLFSFVFLLNACSTSETNQATLVFSFDSVFESNGKQKPTARAIDISEVTAISLTIDDENSDFTLTESINSNSGEIAISVPTNTPLKISGQAFQGDSVVYQGESRVEPIAPGESRNVSFIMYGIVGEPVQIDIGLANKPADGPSTGSSISLSRNYVLFTSQASNLVEGDENGIDDLFLRDLNSNRIINLHSDSNGSPANSIESSTELETAISVDGRYVVFSSAAENLVANDSNGVSDVFLKDTITGETKRISLNDDGTQANQASTQPDISNDGQRIIFHSFSGLLGDGGNKLFVYDRLDQRLIYSISNASQVKLSGDGIAMIYIDTQDGSLILLNEQEESFDRFVSYPENSEETSLDSDIPVSSEYEINVDGNFVVFVPNISVNELLANHVYLYDRQKSQFSLLSEKQGVPLALNDTDARHPDISEDGRYIVFQFSNRIYVKDVATGFMQNIAEGKRPFISPDGLRFGYTDNSGRLLLHDNPLYSANNESPTEILDAPAELSIAIDAETSDIQIDWAAVNNSRYYRVYIASEPGITPENYFQLENNAQFETFRTQLIIPFDTINTEYAYAIVTAINNAGESMASVETELALPFRIISSNPDNNAENIVVGTTPSISFNRQINQETINSNSLIIREGESQLTGEIIFPDDNSVNFIPSSPLAHDTQYEIFLTEDVTDLKGQAIPSARTIRFSTAPADVILYTVNSTVAGNGTVNPTTSQVVIAGDQTQFTLAANAGHHVDQVTGCSGSLSENIYTTAPVTADCTINISFAINNYTLSYSTDGNGSVVGNSNQTASHGANGTAVTATPVTGYRFINWSDDSTANPRTDSNVTSNINVTANFAINRYNVNYSAGPNGSLIGNAAQSVNHGANGTAITANPATGYHFVNWSDDSTENPRTDNNVTNNISVTANFAINRYNVNYSAGPNGSLTGNVEQSVNHGANGTVITANPANGYHFVNWSDDSTENPRTDSNITNNINLTANFAINSYNVNYSAGPNGSLIGNAAQSVNHGANGTAITANPATGYHFVNWSDDSIENPRTDSNVTSNINIIANFAINTYNVSLIVGSGGNVSPANTQTVSHGATISFTVTPDTNYSIESAVGCGGSLLGNIYTTAVITGNCSVEFSFLLNNTPPTITNPTSISITENIIDVATINASDTGTDPITFMISAGPDQNLFTIDLTSGLLSFISPPNYELPADSTSNNIYQVEVTANDGILDSIPKLFSITVKNAKETGLLLNDTGVTQCNDMQNLLSCPQTLFPGQDADFGRDKTLNNNSDGHAGFSFTKLDSNGNVLPITANSWSCLIDNNTGSVWEVKTTDGGLRDGSKTYTYSNALTYVNNVNSLNLCGYNDWRLPDVNELLSIIDFSVRDPAIDTQFFPNTNAIYPSYYWSGRERSANTSQVYAIQFMTGATITSSKTQTYFVRLIRGE